MSIKVCQFPRSLFYASCPQWPKPYGRYGPMAEMKGKSPERLHVMRWGFDIDTDVYVRWLNMGLMES